jgi:hypothetical protein
MACGDRNTDARASTVVINDVVAAALNEWHKLYAPITG